ncbi:uncharacterized protein [Palaemon carinicauda]|uniref:uncharacterized protein n=1 Tax=Palaemon carinicauda TaxID=392227 RepID=UPI0035B59862
MGDLVKELTGAWMSEGIAYFNTEIDKIDGASNGTSVEKLVGLARQVRLHHHEVKMIVLSDDPTFLSAFARMSLKRRLLAGHSKLLVIGRLSLKDVKDLTVHWTYAMMDSHFVIPSAKLETEGWNIYSYLPFSASGSRLSPVGFWRPSKGLVLEDVFLFPRKFENMYGGTVNVSTLPYEPYWVEKRTEGGGDVLYSGTDRLLLEAMASFLNFSIYVLPVKSWEEVLQTVANRSAWVVPIIHVVTPARLTYLDFTRTYEHDVNLAFVMVKPVIELKWQSLYYPLTDEVWLLILGTVLVVSLSLFEVLKICQSYSRSEETSLGRIAMCVFGTLLSQTLDRRIDAVSRGVSSRFLIISWLVSAFVIGTIYKGNLIASILAPRYPPRPETPDQLVKVVDRVTMPSFEPTLRNMLRESSAESRRALGNMMELGYETKEGLELTLKYRYPHVDSLRYLQHQLALHYTEADGTSSFYIGREGLVSPPLAWPVLPDAPFKELFNYVISVLIEGGIYNKWMNDWIDHAKKTGQRMKRRQMIESQLTTSKQDGSPLALTTVHFQGPLLLWFVGLFVSGLAFTWEYFVLYYMTEV